MLAKLELEQSMRIAGTLPLVIGIMIAPQAYGKAVWDIAPRWLCRSTSMAVCHEPGDCRRDVPEAIFEVDFGTGQISAFKSIESELIATKEFLPGRNRTGISFFSTSGGQSFAILEQPKEGLVEDGETLRFQGATLYGDSQTFHYGECRVSLSAE